MMSTSLSTIQARVVGVAERQAEDLALLAVGPLARTVRPLRVVGVHLRQRRDVAEAEVDPEQHAAFMRECGKWRQPVGESVGEWLPVGVLPAEIDHEQLDAESLADVEALTHPVGVDVVAVTPAVELHERKAFVVDRWGEHVVGEPVAAVGQLVQITVRKSDESRRCGERAARGEPVVGGEEAVESGPAVTGDVAELERGLGVGLPTCVETLAVAWSGEAEPGRFLSVA